MCALLTEMKQLNYKYHKMFIFKVEVSHHQSGRNIVFISVVHLSLKLSILPFLTFMIEFEIISTSTGRYSVIDAPISWIVTGAYF